MDVNGATAVLRASPEGVTAECDPEPRVPSEESPKSSSATGASERSTHANILSEDTQCSTPKDATTHLGDPKKATGAPNLPDTFKMDNSPSTEAVSIKDTTHVVSNQEKNGTTSPPKGQLPDSKTADGIRKDAKVAGVPTATKNIPTKRDRMDPLKLDMTKPTVMPLTCMPSTSIMILTYTYLLLSNLCFYICLMLFLCLSLPVCLPVCLPSLPAVSTVS